MTGRNARRAAAISVAVAVLASCAGAPIPAKGAGDTPETAAAQRRGRGTAERAPGTGLGAAAFAGLPEGVAAYLERLAEAFRAKDAEFLLSQGERDYERRVRGTVDEDAYLALLYRVGPYSAERPADSDRPPRLRAERLRSLRYTGWDDRGPVAEIRGRIALSDGATLPCRIAVLWKLAEPRVLGEEP